MKTSLEGYEIHSMSSEVVPIEENDQQYGDGNHIRFPVEPVQQQVETSDIKKWFRAFLTRFPKPCTCPYLFNFTLSMVLLFIFLQELIVNFTTFNGRCVGPVLYPSPGMLTPAGENLGRIVNYGYGACENNLGFNDVQILVKNKNLGEFLDYLINSPDTKKIDYKNFSLFRVSPRQQCAYGKCASDKGWPDNRVMGGKYLARETEADAINSRIINIVGGLNTNNIRNYGEYFLIFWSAFVHISWTHLVLNVLSQVIALAFLEPGWGSCRCLFLWFISAVSGNLLSSVFDPCSVTVGSSGGVYGLLGGMLIYTIEIWEYSKWPWINFLMMAFIILIAHLSNVLVYSNVDNYSHLGGCLGGILFGLSTIKTLAFIRNGAVGIIWKEVLLLPVISRCLNSQKRTMIENDINEYYRRKRERIRHLSPNKPTYVCNLTVGWLEWLVRIVSLTLLMVSLSFLCLYLLVPSFYETVPTPGRMNIFGFDGCFCCRIPEYSEYLAKHSRGLPIHHPLRSNGGQFWCFAKQFHAAFFCKIS